MNTRQTITIQPIQESDIEEILRIQEQSNLSPWQAKDYLSEVGNDRSRSFIIKNHNSIIGFIVARLITAFSGNMPDGSISESEIEIYNLGITKSYRNRGIGTLLLEKTIQTVRNHNISIWLEVRESNLTAISFYKKNKFEEIYRRRNFYNFPNEDAIVMKLEVSKRVGNLKNSQNRNLIQQN